MNSKVKKTLTIIVTMAAIITVSFIIWYIWPLLNGGTQNITRQNRDFIKQMRDVTYGNLIRKVNVNLIGELEITVYVRLSAKDEELLALAEVIKPLVDERFPNAAVFLSFIYDGNNILYSYRRLGGVWVLEYSH